MNSLAPSSNARAKVPQWQHCGGLDSALKALPMPQGN